MGLLVMNPLEKNLSHLNDDGKPMMVDVSQKVISRRTASAQALVKFPPDVAELFRASGFRSKKGSVFDVAVIAATMAVKKTSDVIPFCHQLPIESCRLQIEMNDKDVVVIECTVSVEAKTGVEMEALHGASVAALIVYDMCKALSHRIEIESIKLLSKTGGKS